MLIAIDGIDGAGKTTLAQQLADLLVALDPIIEKEPTNHSVWGRKLRETSASGRLSKEEELELFHKDRMHHIETIIKPALDRDCLVLLDRYVDSTLAFQASSPEEAEALYQEFLPDILIPDITFILDCSAEVGLERIATYRESRTEFEKLTTLKIAQQIYESRKGPTYQHLDASGTIEETLNQTINALLRRFPHLKKVMRPADLGNTSKLVAL